MLLNTQRKCELNKPYVKLELEVNLPLVLYQLGSILERVEEPVLRLLLSIHIKQRLFQQTVFSTWSHDSSYQKANDSSSLQEPVYEYVYPFEALEGLTMALMMTSAVTYVAKISSPQTMASVMGIMGALFFGVGKGSGSLFGGLLMSFIGARNTFRSAGFS